MAVDNMTQGAVVPMCVHGKYYYKCGHCYVEHVAVSNAQPDELSTAKAEIERLTKALDRAVTWLTAERNSYPLGTVGRVHLQQLLKEIESLREGKQ